MVALHDFCWNFPLSHQMICKQHIVLNHVFFRYKSNLKPIEKQECIPVGCIPPAHWLHLVVSSGACMPGGHACWGDVWSGGACPGDVHAWGCGGCAQGRGHVCPGGHAWPGKVCWDTCMPPCCGQNSWHMLAKTLPFRNYCCGRQWRKFGQGKGRFTTEVYTAKFHLPIICWGQKIKSFRWQIQDFPEVRVPAFRWGATHVFAKCSQKLHEIERIWTLVAGRGGLLGGASLRSANGFECETV